MSALIEFHGRLARSDKRPASPGKYDLLFQLHGSMTGDAVLWSEVVRNVVVMPGGFFSVLLGQGNEIAASVFARVPRYVSVRVVRSGRVGDEHGTRTPVSGAEVVLEGRLSELEVRVGAMDAAARTDDVGVSGNLAEQLESQLEAMAALQARLEAFEQGDESAVLHRRIDKLTAELGSLSAEDGRLQHIEDELEDLVGPDGDVVDLNERMDFLEGRAPELIANLRQREAAASRDNISSFRKELQALEARVTEFDGQVANLLEQIEALRSAEPPSADVLGVVRRTGDVMTGGLVINRGGLEVLSGGINSRSATVTTLEASNLVKTPKAIIEALELRGDLTVDNTKRVLQCRQIEGRQGSSRKDGPLHLNSRGGAEVVMGTPEARKGATVHGTLLADDATVNQGCTALAYPASGDPLPGDVVRLTDDGLRAGRCTTVGDPMVVGVVVSTAGLILGGPITSGRVAVAQAGVVECNVDAAVGAIAIGDLLGGSATPGHAQRLAAPGPGSVIAKALEPLEAGTGRIRVLIWRG